MSDQQNQQTKADRRKYAVIVAGGKGLRMASKTPKQFLPLCGKPVLYHTLEAFVQAFADINIILVYPQNDLSSAKEIIRDFKKGNIVSLKGGDTRFQSVKNGLEAVTSPGVIFVHDGVRPLVSTELIRRCYQETLSHGTAVPALPLRESIRRIEDERSVAVDRNAFRSIQTPQTFLSEILLPAFQQPYESTFTDEATVVERAGEVIHLIPGEEDNIKITRPQDMWLAERILLERGKRH